MLPKSNFASIKDIPTGYILNAWFYNRMHQENKNVLIAIIGKTGSGKSWCSLSICEQWYRFRFNKEFPVDNVCFSIDEVTNRLLNGNLKRGELLILEEGGVNLSNLDFQNKMVKTFTFVLQSFRSMNVGLIINLPYFSMLNKQTRMLMHMLLETMNIDTATRHIVLKPLHLQYNQRSGKEYFHYPKVLIDGSYERIQRIRYPAPSELIVNPYEEKKRKFVMGVVEKVEEVHQDTNVKYTVSETDVQIYYLRVVKQLPYKEIAPMFGITEPQVGKLLSRAEKRGINTDMLQKYEKYLKKLPQYTEIPTPLPASN